MSRDKVAQAFSAIDVSTTLSILNDTGAKYLLTSSRDVLEIAYVFFRGAGLDPNDYIKNEPQANPYIQPT